MSSKSVIITALFIAFSVSSFPAQAGILFSGIGAVSDGLTQYNDSSGSPHQGKIGYGGGLLIAIGLSPRIRFETGGLYLLNKFQLKSDDTASIYIPAGFRLYFSRAISFSGGAFSNIFSKSHLVPDYGWEAGARISIARVFIEGRYSDGLRDYGNGYRYSNVIGLIGFHLGVIR